MSVIAVKGIPPKWSLMNVVKILAKTIGGTFDALNFQQGPKARAMKTKICYLRLSEKLDPVRVVEKINTSSFPKGFRPFAYIPDYVPDLPLAAQPKGIPFRMRKALKIREENPPEKVFSLTTTEILTELQLKYPGLYNVSLKTNHKLLEELAKKIHDRLTAIAERNKDVAETCFKLSQWYRRMHPHFGDFQLVLSTLHAIEDEAGTARTQLEEKTLTVRPPHPYTIDNLPYTEVQAACNKYSERIIRKVNEHVRYLKLEVEDTDNEDEIVRKKVREELKKMTPFLPMIVKQVVTKHFIPQTTQNCRVWIYGEPFLPGKDTMAPFIRRYQPVHVRRSERMFNNLRMAVPPIHHASLMAMDGTVLNGATLVIRPADLPLYKPSADSLGGGGGEDLQPEQDNEEPMEDWDEMEN